VVGAYTPIDPPQVAASPSLLAAVARSTSGFVLVETSGPPHSCACATSSPAVLPTRGGPTMPTESSWVPARKRRPLAVQPRQGLTDHCSVALVRSRRGGLGPSAARGSSQARTARV